MTAGNLPNISFIHRKPEPLGTEMKCVCCAKTRVMLYLEIQRGRDGMRDAEFTNKMIKTAACTARLIKYSSLRKNAATGANSEAERRKPTYLGDAYFGSIPSVVAADS